MKSHVEVLALINIVTGVLGALAGLLVFGLLILLAPVANDPIGSPVMVIVAATVGGLLALLSIPAVIAGVGLLKFKPWARILALILGIISLLNIPIGTLIGIYTLWVLTNEESEKLLTA